MIQYIYHNLNTLETQQGYSLCGTENKKSIAGQAYQYKIIMEFVH